MDGSDSIIVSDAGTLSLTGNAANAAKAEVFELALARVLGGPEPHGRRSGVVHILTESEQEAIDRAVRSKSDDAALAKIKSEVAEFCKKFPMPH